ncbi:hypothetical protein [Microbispora sp. ATCC PTA-5024]|uniref:hypothetical protein n=1 Tax=Microbispora sp. ATCC PTA-5024 TaxID=316330 RepID=UPI0003DCEA19|nr:hypothetical protein [Microbispora sp. ATCC PTA-5024]ETK35511.1 hypothetical protein MPTA5024_13865 [Microbispora sp. ATCC PTA-5024]
MAVVERDDVRRLLESPAPDATLVLVEGRCEVVPGDAADGLVIASRRDLEDEVGGEDLDDGQLGRLADRLDSVVRDLGA